MHLKTVFIFFFLFCFGLPFLLCRQPFLSFFLFFFCPFSFLPSTNLPAPLLLCSVRWSAPVVDVSPHRQHQSGAACHRRRSPAWPMRRQDGAGRVPRTPNQRKKNNHWARDGRAAAMMGIPALFRGTILLARLSKKSRWFFWLTRVFFWLLLLLVFYYQKMC